MQTQLHNIFDEEMQIKRINKEISLFTSNEETKALLEHRFTYIRKQELIFHITLKPTYMNKHKLDTSLCPLRLKIIYTNTYPYTQPRLYFVSENINQLYTVNGRDYFKEVCPNWGARTQLLEIIPRIATFIGKISKEEHQHRVGTYNRGEFIEMEPLYTLKTSEFYPIQVIINQKPESAFLIINRFDFILLEPSTIQNYLRLVDAYSLSSIKYILRSKRTEKKVLLLMRIMDNQVGLEFLSDDHDNIVESIIQKKRTAPIYETAPDQKVPQDEQEEKEEIKQQSPGRKVSLQQINQEIVIFQSLLDKEFSETVVTNLIQLYNKAIQICSVTTSDLYKLYLDKLHELLSNQAVQVLMNSTVPQKSNKVSIFEGWELEKPSQKSAEKKDVKSQEDMIEFFDNPKSEQTKNDNVLDLL